MKLIVQLTFIFVILTPSFAQIEAEYFDTKGKDFWLTFLPNYHNGKFIDESVKYDDSLYIIIIADKPSIGIINYVDINGVEYSRNFNIDKPDGIYIFSVYYRDFELIGFNDSGNDITNRYNSEVITKQYFHITTDNEVTVYAHNHAHTTSDACLVFPTDILGKDYFVMSYNSDGESGYTIDIGSGSTPSQFIILATEDSTNVTIIPKEETAFFFQNIQNIIMNKGDSYLVQARITKLMLQTDLTGTEIISDKPIAVFSGHQRATIPNNNNFINPSRDYLLEQMPPIQSWGQNALLFPFFKPKNVSNINNDIYRILAGYDNTDLYLNGSLVTTLNKGEFYEGEIINASFVWANAPILVAQFKKTSIYDFSGNDDINGDPFELLIPPVEHFMKNYKVVNFQTIKLSNSDLAYLEHYISIIAPNTSISNITIDSNLVEINSFYPITNTNYSYANIAVTAGTHIINSDTGIGVCVYGYGNLNSYGYLAGMYMDPIVVAVKDSSEGITINNTLYQNKPNPASCICIIEFDLNISCDVKLVIYDLIGNQRIIVNNPNMEPGIKEIQINTDKLEDGIYIYSLLTGDGILSRKMIVNK